MVLTAAHDAAKRAAEIAADGYLPKPFDVDELLDAVSGYAASSAASGR